MAITDADDLGPMSDQGLMDSYDHVRDQINRLTAERLVLMGEVHTRCLSTIDGHTATTTWLTHRHNLKRPVVARDLRLARCLSSMPATHMALEAGEICVERAHRMTQALNKNAELFSRDEKMLLARTAELSFAHFCNTIRYWEMLADPDDDKANGERSYEDRKLYMSRVGEQWVINGHSDILSGTEIAEGLARIEKELFDNDWAEAKLEHGQDTCLEHLTRTPQQRRHDALVEAIRRANSTPAGSKAPEPLVNIVMDFDTFCAQALKATGEDADTNDQRDDSTCELLDGHPISPNIAFRLAVKYQLARIVMEGNSAVLDVGANTRFYTGALRRALIIRDRNCVWPGCEIASAHCEMDHIVDFADGGSTSLRNGQPLCASHHGRKHSKRFTVTKDPNTHRTRFRRADGSEIGSSLPDPPAQSPPGP